MTFSNWQRTKLKQAANLAAVIAIALVLTCCANEKAPEGGKKDTTPPKAKKMYPASKSLHFTSDKIHITFNKFIKSTGFSQTLISPPLEKRPDFKIVNKTLTIKLKSPLRDSTTYTFNFAEDIKDVNEGNILNNFTYVFSTGDFIDSQRLAGKVIIAKDNSLADGVIVSLYPQDSVNAIKRSKPFYFAKTDKSGSFLINNIKAGHYNVFALKDENYNYIFDQPNEMIAFYDSLVYLNDTFPQNNAPVLKNDFKKDTTTAIKDSIQRKNDPHLKNIELSLFADGGKIRFLGNKAIALGNIQFYYSQPVSNFQLHVEPPSERVLWYPNDTKDTINYWYSNYYDKKGAFYLSVNDSILDTTRITLNYINIDSFSANKKYRLSVVNQTDTSKSGKNNGENYTAQELYKPVKIFFTRPIVEINESKAPVFYQDSVKKDLPLKLSIDEPSKLSTSFDFTKTENTKYTIEFPDSSFKDIFGSWNRKIIYKFKTTSKDAYGNINLTLKNSHPEKNYLIKLIDRTGAVIKEISFTGEKERKINIPNVAASDYKIIAVDDANGNGKWDTGDFKKKRQPEKVINFKEVHSLKGGWDMDIEVDL